MDKITDCYLLPKRIVWSNRDFNQIIIADSCITAVVTDSARCRVTAYDVLHNGREVGDQLQSSLMLPMMKGYLLRVSILAFLSRRAHNLLSAG